MKKNILIVLTCVICTVGYSQQIPGNAVEQRKFLEWFLDSRTERTISLSPVPIDTSLVKDSLRRYGLSLASPGISKQLKQHADFVIDTTLNASKVYLSLVEIKKRGLPYLQISAPLFVRDEVWIKVEYFCGELCGSGIFLVYKREDKSYRLINTIQLWIS